MTRSSYSRALVAGVALISLALAGCAGTRPDASAVAAGAGRPARSQYVIGAGDVLGVFVYQSPDLSVASLPVRPDGRISLPLIPDIQAGGRTPTELGRDIAARLRHYVKDPNVTIMVQSFVGPLDRQVRVIGAAAEPMAVPYRDSMTVLDVMVAAKGLTRFADGNAAHIVRNEHGRELSIPVHLDSLLNEGRLEDNVAMRPGDTLVIPQTWF